MVVWFKQSLKKRNAEKAELQTQREEISEIQDALVEIAGIVTTMSEATDSGKESNNG